VGTVRPNDQLMAAGLYSARDSTNLLGFADKTLLPDMTSRIPLFEPAKSAAYSTSAHPGSHRGLRNSGTTNLLATTTLPERSAQS